MSNGFFIKKFREDPSVLMISQASDALYNISENEIDETIEKFRQQGFLSDINYPIIYKLILTIGIHRNDRTNIMFSILMKFGEKIPEKINFPELLNFLFENPCLYYHYKENKVVTDYLKMINQENPARGRTIPEETIIYIRTFLNDDIGKLIEIMSSPTYKMPIYLHGILFMIDFIEFACFCGAPKCVKHLITEASNRNRIDINKCMINAYNGGNAEVIRFLEQKGADVVRDFSMIKYHQREIFDWICERYGLFDKEGIAQKSLECGFVHGILTADLITDEMVAEACRTDGVFSKVISEINKEYVPVIEAVREGNMEKLQLLFKSFPPDVAVCSDLMEDDECICDNLIYERNNYLYFWFKTPLLEACRLRKLDFIEYILSLPDVDINRKVLSQPNLCPLIYCLDHNKIKPAECLFFNQRFDIHYDPDEVFYKSCDLSSKIANYVYLNHKIDFFKCENRWKREDNDKSLIHKVFMNGNKFLISEILNDDQYEIKSRISFLSCFSDHNSDEECALIVLRHEKLSIYRKNEYMGHLLIYCINGGKSEIARELLKEEFVGPEKALVKVFESKEYDVLDRLLDLYDDSVDVTVYSKVLVSIIRMCDSSMLKLFLERCPSFDINYVYNKENALIKACIVNRPKIVEILLSYQDIDVNKVIEVEANEFSTDKSNERSALSASLKTDSFSCVELLLHHPNIDVNAVVNGELLLDAAIHHSDTSIIELLINHPNIDLTRNESEYNSSFAKACSSGRFNVAKMLFEKPGAKVDSIRGLFDTLNRRNFEFADFLVNNVRYDNDDLFEDLTQLDMYRDLDIVKFILNIEYFEFPEGGGTIDYEEYLENVDIEQDEVKSLILKKLHRVQ